jgi:hypothetical protein
MTTATEKRPLGELDLETAAQEARGNWKEFSCFGWHCRPEDCDNWAVVYTHNRDSGLLDQSNATVVAAALAPFMAGDNPEVRPERHRNWLCGWIDGYSIRVYREGEITEAFRAYHELAARLVECAVLDEEDLSRREHEATLENLRHEGFDGERFAPPKDWAGEVFSWLSDHNQRAVEDRDGAGGYATQEQIAEALTALGYRIRWAVSYVDVGETTEEFLEESEAIARVTQLRGAGFIGATYREVKPLTPMQKDIADSIRAGFALD